MNVSSLVPAVRSPFTHTMFFRKPGLSVYQNRFLGLHATEFLPKKSLTFGNQQSSSQYVYTTFGVSPGAIGSTTQTQFEDLQLLQTKAIYGPNTVPVGRPHICARPCSPTNFPFIDGLSSFGRVNLDALLKVSTDERTDILDNMLPVPLFHVNGLSQSGWTVGAGVAELLQPVLNLQLQSRLDTQDGIVTVGLLGKGPVMEHLLWMFANNGSYFPTLDWDRIQVIRIDNQELSSAHQFAAALHHHHLGSQSYPFPTLHTAGDIVSRQTPIGFSPSFSGLTFGMKMAASQFDTPEVMDKNNIVHHSAKGWGAYQEQCTTLGLESGFYPTGFCAIPLDERSIPSILKVPQERGEKGFKHLTPEETAKLMMTRSPELYPHGSVLFGQSTLTPYAPENGVIDRDQYSQTVRKIVDASTLKFTEMDGHVESVTVDDDRVQFGMKDQRIDTDIAVVCPGVRSKDLGLSGRHPTPLYGIGRVMEVSQV